MGLISLFTLLLLVNLSVQKLSSEVCPRDQCRCTRDLVRCLHQELVTVPKAVPVNITTYDLRFNIIDDIAPGVFEHLQKLKALLLNDNKLKALRSGAFLGLQRLKYLYLYRNRIKHIDSDVFHGMEHLQQLYLQVNEIIQIEPGTFSYLPRLERLYLQNNNLRSIPAGSFKDTPSLQKLRLDSNALFCDCSLLWLVQMMSLTDISVAATCYGPDNAMGSSLSTMSERDFNCEQPKIQLGPEDAEVNFGDDVLFTCVATGEPQPEIVWMRDDNLITNLESSHYEVMNNGSLMIHEADESDKGVFECMAKNPVGEAKSKPVKVMMKEAEHKKGMPVFIVLPRKQIATFHQDVNFDCVAKGNPTPHVVWLYNDERILLDERIILNHNGTMTIKNIRDTDAGLYTCQAENTIGRVSASASLEVMASPSFVVVPKDITLAVGDDAEFTCTAKGLPTPVITWFKNTLTLPENENIALSNNNDKLTITEVSFDDAGLYHCRAENNQGLIEISAELKIDEYQIEVPKIITKPEDTDAFKGTSIQLPCEVESIPPATIEWRRNGARLEQDNKTTITVIGSLIVNNLTIADGGRYECSAFNEYGRDTKSVFVTIKDQTLPGDAYVNIALTEAARDVDQAISRTVDQILHHNTSGVNVHELYQITRFPNAPAREVARAAEVYELTLNKVRGFVQHGFTVTSAEPFNFNSVLSREHLDVIARLSGCVAHREKRDCSDMCYHNKYRSIDGSCNNFANPTWGSSLSGFRRIMFPVYENGFSQPVGWNKEVKYNGFTLPGARLVSTSIITTEVISQDSEITHMVMQWGQWLDHDLDHALPSVSSQTWDGVDCKKTCDYSAPCFPIDVPANDSRVTNRRCIDFIRTSSVCGSGETSVLFGSLQPREQINQLTSFLDASQVYGFEKAVADDLRDLTNDNGFLRVGATFPGKKPLLPTIGINGMDCRRNLEESSRNCFVAGDIRANEQIGLAAMHTIWMREHNRLAATLKALNPFWDGDKVYHESRKIVGAEMQFITYEHWLPIILGPEGHQQMGKYKAYDPKLNPSVSNVFATAALRFGHSIINPILHRYDENFETIPQGHLTLRNAFFAPWRLVDEGGVDPLLRGMFITPAKLKTPTQNLNSELTEQLFHTSHAVALDLAAINIQRGRDHAIPSYTKFRQFCNMTDVNSFDDLANEISDDSIRNKLKELYGSVDNIDVWVGGILEDQVEGGKVGPLFRCLLIEQFNRLRDGDRFWYENPSTFKPDQLNQIKETSLARVLCDNGDNIDTIGENVFFLPEVQDGMIACDDLASMDMRFWVDCESCNEIESDDAVKRTRRNAEAIKRDEVHILKEVYNLKDYVEILKKRIEHLEDTCQNTNI